MDFESFLNLFDHRKKSGEGYLVRCPAHDDRNPSLSVSAGSDRNLYHCHAGCLSEEVRQALGIEKRDLFFSTPLQEPGKQKRKIIETYDYRDEDGNLVFQTVRYEPKDFRQRRPDGNGGWHWNLRGVKLIPYNLPQVLEQRSSLSLKEKKMRSR